MNLNRKYRINMVLHKNEAEMRCKGVIKMVDNISVKGLFLDRRGLRKALKVKQVISTGVRSIQAVLGLFNGVKKSAARPIIITVGLSRRGWIFSPLIRSRRRYLQSKTSRTVKPPSGAGNTQNKYTKHL